MSRRRLVYTTLKMYAKINFIRDKMYNFYKHGNYEKEAIYLNLYIDDLKRINISNKIVEDTF